MSHKMHIKRIRIVDGGLVMAALLVALWLHQEALEPAREMVDSSRISVDREGVAHTDIARFDIVGIRSRIRLDDPNSILGLWRRFEESAWLHAGIDWSVPQAALAYYHDIDTDASSAMLTIGYAADRFENPEGFDRQAVTPGRHRHYSMAGSDAGAVTDTWDRLLRNNPSPGAVIERYRLDPWGNVLSIQIQVLDPR